MKLQLPLRSQKVADNSETPLRLWQPAQQQPASSPFGSPKASQHPQLDFRQHASLTHSTPQLVSPASSAPLNTALSGTSTHSIHLPTTATVVSSIPEVANSSPPLQRSMSALDMAPSGAGERVRAGKGSKVATCYDFEGKVRGGMYRAASYKSNSFFEGCALASVDSCNTSCTSSPLNRLCSSPLRLHPDKDSSFSLCCPTKQGSRPSFKDLAGGSAHNGGACHSPTEQTEQSNSLGEGSRRSGSTHRAACNLLHSSPIQKGSRSSCTSSESSSNQSLMPSFPSLRQHKFGAPYLPTTPSPTSSAGPEAAAGHRSDGPQPRGNTRQQEEGHSNSRDSIRLAAGAAEEVEGTFSGAGGTSLTAFGCDSGFLSGVKDGLIEAVMAEEEEQRGQGLFVGVGSVAGHASPPQDGSCSSQEGPESERWSGSLLMVVAEEEGDGQGSRNAVLPQGSGKVMLDSRPQQHHSQHSHSLSHVVRAAQKSSSGKFYNNQEHPKEGYAANSYGSCSSSLSLLEFADETSNRTFGNWANKSMPQSPSSALYKVRPSGSGESIQSAVSTLTNSCSSIQSSMCSQGQKSSMDGFGTLSKPQQLYRNNSFGNHSCSRRALLAIHLQPTHSASLPHPSLLAGQAALSPQSPCCLQHTLSVSYNSLLDFAEASARSSQTRKLDNCSSGHLACQPSVDEELPVCFDQRAEASTRRS